MPAGIRGRADPWPLAGSSGDAALHRRGRASDCVESVLYWFFGLYLGWLPVAKWAGLDEGIGPYVSHIILPAI